MLEQSIRIENIFILIVNKFLRIVYRLIVYCKSAGFTMLFPNWTIGKNAVGLYKKPFCEAKEN